MHVRSSESNTYSKLTAWTHLVGDFSCTHMVTACSKFCTWALILVQWSPNCLRKGKLRHAVLGVEPYDVEDADGICKSLVHKGIVCLADIKFPLPYRAKSYSLVIVSDALDYLSPKYLNKMLSGFDRVSTDSLVVFTGTFFFLFSLCYSCEIVLSRIFALVMIS
jgi:hypothetical protein